MAPQAIAEALFSTSAMVRGAAIQAAIVWSRGKYSGADPFRVPTGRVDVDSMLAVFDPAQSSVDDRARAFTELRPAIESASVAAVQSSPERAQVVADMLLSRGGKPAFGLFTRDLERASPELLAQAERDAQVVAGAVAEPFVALCRHPAADVRALAVRFLATRNDPSVVETVSDALLDRDPAVVEATLASLRPVHLPGARSRIVALLAHGTDWSLRVRAAEALGRLAGASSDSEAIGALAGAAENDEFALVREAAIRALARVGPRAATPVLRRAVSRDPEPRVRQTARALLR